MILSTAQPYFAPYSGFFLKIYMSDVFVLLDTVQFPRGGTWLTRNRFKNDNGRFWINIPVWKKGLGLQRIDQVRICDEFFHPEKILLSLEHAYSRAPYFKEHYSFLQKVFNDRPERLVDINLQIINHIMDYMGINTRLLLLSELGIHGKGDELIINICRGLGAGVFLAQRPAIKYMNQESFKEAGIEIKWFNPPIPVYPQLWGDFIPNLSTLDLLFNCGTKALDIITQKTALEFKVS